MARGVPSGLVFTFAAAVALLAAGASAAPCIPCSACVTDNCNSYCSESCPDEAPPAQPDAQPAPSDVTVSVTACIKQGAGYGTTAADKACRLAATWCNGGRPLGAAEAADAADATNVAQCSSAAMGACQRVALAKSPCAGMLQNGFKDCSPEQVMAQKAFWRGEVQSHCHEWAAQMTDVNPGTNAWRGGPGGEGQQQAPQDGGWTNYNARRLLSAPPSLYQWVVRLPQQPRATVAAA